MADHDLTPAGAIDVVSNATEGAFRELEGRLRYLEAGLVDATRANARAIAGLLRDLGGGPPASSSQDEPVDPVKTAVDPAKDAVTDKGDGAADKGDPKGKAAEEVPIRKSRHRFL